MAARARRTAPEDQSTTSRPAESRARRPSRKTPLDAAPPKPATGAGGERHATVHEAKTHLSRLLAEVEAGGRVVITRRGKPVARLEAVQRKGPRIPGSMKGLIAFDESFFDPLPDDELEAWGET